MSYLVLARKWRPNRFTDVVGQDLIVKTLSTALSTGRIAHAFLLTGSRGTGKTTVARLLAKSLACTKGISDSPCGTCTPCKEIAAGTSMDIIEIDGASNTGVDDVRELRENIRYQPTTCRFKIFIIDEVHMLSTNAFNALLKTLEEPPAHVKFIFATTEPHKIPITILSRCQRYDFKRLPTPTIIDRLRYVLSKEEVTIDDDGLLLIAQAAQGGMRDALSLTDQVLSFAPHQASAQDVALILGIMDRGYLIKATKAILEGNTKEALTLVREIYTCGHDLKQLVEGIAAEIRHLCIASTLGSAQDFVDLSPENIAQIDALAKQQDPTDLQRLFAMALDGIDQVARANDPKIATELVFLRMSDRPKMADAITITTAIARLEALAKGGPVAVNTPLVVSKPELEEKKKPLTLATTTPIEQKSVPVLTATTQVQDNRVKSEDVSPVSAPLVSTSVTKAKPQVETSAEPPTVVAPYTGNPLLFSQLEGVDEKWLEFVRLTTEHSPGLTSFLVQAYFLGHQQTASAHTVKAAFKHQLQQQYAQEEYLKCKAENVLQTVFGANACLELLVEDVQHTCTITQAIEQAEQKAQAALEAKAKADPFVQKALALFGGEIRTVKRQ